MRNGGCSFYSSVVQNVPRVPQARIGKSRAGVDALGFLLIRRRRRRDSGDGRADA
jgi:hypothetical protein